MDLMAEPKEEPNQHHQPPPSFRPVPKPRKSLMMNTAVVDASISDSKGQFSLYNKPPPPLPPRAAAQFSPPLPYQPLLPSLPERIDFATTKTTSISFLEEKPLQCTYQQAVTAINANGCHNNRIYPILMDDLIVCSPTTSSSQFPPHLMDSASNFSSDYSNEDYHSVSGSPTTFKSSVDFNSSPEEIKSDGESVCFSGWIQLVPHGIIRQRKRGWAMLQKNKLFISQNDESSSPFFGPISMHKCVFLGREAANKSGEISLVFRDCSPNGKAQKGNSQSEHSTVNLRFTPEDNDNFWLLFLAKCCFPDGLLPDESLDSPLQCFGQLWIKQGIGGLWSQGWAFARNRMLHYSLQGGSQPTTVVDIRKIIMIKRRDVPASDWCPQIENSTNGPILISMEGSSLCVQALNDHCTSIWLDILTAELNREARVLEECRLTADDVPVIVDKCIRLISTYGLYQQGIYRKNGSAAEARKLMQAFRDDPYSVYLKSPITDETIFAVAGVLRTFFRQLDRPLVPVDLHEKLYEISILPNPVDKPCLYQQLVHSLPKVYFKTLRKLLGHLQEVISHESRNLASLDNISKIFGPTLFNVSNSEGEVSVEWYTMATRQTIVMHDLVFHYCDIFGVTADELLTKCKLDVIQDQKASKNPATGLLLPIHVFERDNKCFNIQSEWTASQVVSYKLENLPFVPTAEAYALFEMVRGGQLERRIGPNESLRSIVLGRWMDWELHEDNFLLLKKDSNPFQPQSGRAFADNIKLAEPGSRSFKSVSLRIEEGTRVCLFSKGLKKQNEWKLDEMLWFLGAESDRKCPLQFPLTFFVSSEKKAAKCRGKLPGYCVAFREEVNRQEWLNCICLNQSEYLAQPLIQI